jgi:hypothetical protein
VSGLLPIQNFIFSNSKGGPFPLQEAMSPEEDFDSFKASIKPIVMDLSFETWAQSQPFT